MATRKGTVLGTTAVESGNKRQRHCLTARRATEAPDLGVGAAGCNPGADAAGVAARAGAVRAAECGEAGGGGRCGRTGWPGGGQQKAPADCEQRRSHRGVRQWMAVPQVLLRDDLACAIQNAATRVRPFVALLMDDHALPG